MRKKIILLNRALSDGGAERVASNISLFLSDNIDITLLLLDDKARIDYPYRGSIVYLEKFVPKGIWNIFPTKGFSFFKRLNNLKKIKKLNPNVITISFLEYPNLLNVLSGNLTNSMVSVRNYMSKKHSNGIQGIFWNFTIRYFYRKVKKVIAVSQEVKKDLIVNYNIPQERIKVIYNSYPIQRIETLSDEELSEEELSIFNKPTIITVGRLEEQKGQYHLIRSFQKVKKIIPDSQLVILGEGELKSFLKEQVEKLNLLDSVHFLGFKKNPFKYISKSQVFAMTSYYEGFPNALAEAMACGIPVVSTDCLSGPREILAPDEYDEKNIDYKLSKNRYGILIPVCKKVKHDLDNGLSEEESILADRLISLLTNKDLQDFFSQAAKKRIKQFDIQETIKEWEKLITENKLS